MTEKAKARIGITFNDAWLIAGVRTPFVDDKGALAARCIISALESAEFHSPGSYVAKVSSVIE